MDLLPHLSTTKFSGPINYTVLGFLFYSSWEVLANSSIHSIFTFTLQQQENTTRWKLLVQQQKRANGMLWLRPSKLLERLVNEWLIFWHCLSSLIVTIEKPWVTRYRPQGT